MASKYYHSKGGPRTGPSHQDNSSASQDNSVLPGIKPVLEMLRDNPRHVDTVFIRKGRKDAQTSQIMDLCRSSGVRFNLVEADFLQRLCPANNQGVAARLFSAGFSSLEEVAEAALQAPLPLLLALDQVLDPGNAGTLVRTLYALGGGGLIVPKHNGAYLGAGAAKSAAGAMQKLPIAKVTNLAQALDKLEEQGFMIYGAVAGEGSESVYDFKPDFPAVLVLGSEEEGLRPGIAKRCSKMLQIPMPRDFNSLNVAQAGAIMLGFFSSARLKG